mmetsp:Transcript_18260/g.25730  ORF Transcript_18260/g.25730 Transcript_18260/m.25730 type:complete len:190 (-) Transcript_18260:142-711(-)
MTHDNFDECHAAVPLLEDPTMFLLESGTQLTKESATEKENADKANLYGICIAAILGFDLGYVAPWAIVAGQAYLVSIQDDNKQNGVNMFGPFEILSCLWVVMVALGVLYMNIVCVRALISRLDMQEKPEIREAKLDFWFSSGALTGIVVACAMVFWRMKMDVDQVSSMLIIAVYVLGIAVKYILYRSID